MVALNFQTPDLAMQLNQGKCEYNGSCGLVQYIAFKVKNAEALHFSHFTGFKIYSQNQLWKGCREQNEILV